MINSHEYNIGQSNYSQKKIQPWDIIDEYGLNFYEGNVIKYMLRQKQDRLSDLEKAKHYIEKLIESYDKPIR